MELFSESFTPTDLSPKYDLDDGEHIELDLTAAGTLTKITWTSAQGAEHIELGVTATGTLTHVNDL